MMYLMMMMMKLFFFLNVYQYLIALNVNVLYDV